METGGITTLDPSWAAIIGALGALVTAIGGLVLAFSVLVPTLRASQVALVKVAEVHQLVNSQHDNLLKYQDALVGALRQNHVVVPEERPDRPGRPPPTGPDSVPTGPAG